MSRKILVGAGLFVVTLVVALFVMDYLEPDENQSPEQPKVPAKKIQVYLSGQVKNVSVVELEDSGNLRLVDAVNLAGGLTDLADTEAINLAEPISDGQHVHIPTKEIFLRESQDFSAAQDSGDKVNINTADAERLATLKGIGPALAQRIIDYREQNGAFKSIDELKNVRGIGDKKFEAFKDKITV